ncbi:STAS domain-containing protein [Saccharothrix sp. S26]|uniref:STAS domain-containing protein n=1 Tax=Saccharothrix sp. S26 TaxID=2907215 RepID=UPI001F3C5569|nr:STAS domain-containing protein [Saccharothrix sp. S26]MCE6995472.1 STAS domain-containing protein [Saccharothrix sp. S26]
MTTVDARRGPVEPDPAGPPVDRAEPAPGVLVLRVTGAVRTPLVEAAQRCLAESPRVLILDLSRATGCDGHGAALVAAVRTQARARGVPVELVVSTNEVARALRFTDPDALLGAWPSLEPVLTTVCPVTEAIRDQRNDDVRGIR